MTLDPAVANLVKVLVSYTLALPMGWEREHDERSAGIRTFPLVAMASCGYVLAGTSFFAAHPDAQSRVIQGLIGGIGFIGAGTILRVAGQVQGTATAASLLVTGIIGMAVALDMYGLAILLSAITLVTLRFLAKAKPQPGGQGRPPSPHNERLSS
jgi:putative Mg2+ transporter-C (MgtC) family protein